MYAFDPHINEYLAAANAIHEQTPSPVPTSDQLAAFEKFTIGCGVTFRLKGWSDASCQTGRVADMHDGRLTLLVETVDDIVEVDPRPWPIGNVLPF